MGSVDGSGAVKQFLDVPNFNASDLRLLLCVSLARAELQRVWIGNLW